MLYFRTGLRRVAPRQTPEVDDSQDPRQVPARLAKRVWLWGVPFAPVSMSEAVSWVERLIAAGKPSFFITANVHYAMLSEEHADLRAINDRAAFIVADGMPLVWASRWHDRPLPERVAGSDLIFEICAVAAQKGYRLFFLGGAEGVARERRNIFANVFRAYRSSAWKAPRFVH